MLMGDASELRLPGFGRLTWKAPADKPIRFFDEAAFAEAHPNLFETWQRDTIKKGTRTFLVKEGEEETPKPKPKAKKKSAVAAA